MADDALTDFDEGFEEFGPKKRMSGKKLVLFIILPMLLLGSGVGAMYGGFLGGGAQSPNKEDHAAAKYGRESSRGGHGAPAGSIFYELPEILVNLNSTGRRPTFLKLSINLELSDSAARDRIEELKPRIIDNFQVYLRELRVDDLRGSAGVYRLREELLARINLSLHPHKVKSVLFKEILIQ